MGKVAGALITVVRIAFEEIDGYRRLAVHRQGQGLPLRPAGNGELVIVREEGAADRGGHQQSGSNGVHRKGLGIQEGVPLAVGALEGQGVGALRQIGKRQRSRGAGGSTHLFSVQRPGAANCLAVHLVQGGGKLVGPIDQGGKCILGLTKFRIRVIHPNLFCDLLVGRVAGIPGEDRGIGGGNGHGGALDLRRVDHAAVVRVLVGGYAHGVALPGHQACGGRVAELVFVLKLILLELELAAGGIDAGAVFFQGHAADAGDQIALLIIEVDPVAVRVPAAGDGKGYLIVTCGGHIGYPGGGGRLVGVGVREGNLLGGGHGLLPVHRDGLEGVGPGGQILQVQINIHAAGEASLAGRAAYHAGVIGIVLIHRQQGDLGKFTQVVAGDGGLVLSVVHHQAVNARQGGDAVEHQVGRAAGSGNAIGACGCGGEGHRHVGHVGGFVVGHVGVGVCVLRSIGVISGIDKGQFIVADGERLCLCPGGLQTGAGPGEGQGGGRSLAGGQGQLVAFAVGPAADAVPACAEDGRIVQSQSHLGLGGQGGVGTHRGVEGPAGFRGGVDGDGGQAQQVGIAGGGVLAVPAHVAAPEIGDAHLNAHGLRRAPHLFGVGAHAHVGQGEAADERQGTGKLEGGLDKELIDAGLLQHQVAAAGNNVPDVHIDRGQEEEFRVPVKLQIGALQNHHAFGHPAVGQVGADALQTQIQLRPGRDDLEEGELGLQNELEGGNRVGEEDGIVQIVDAAARALEPQHTHSVQVDAGGKAPHKEPEGVGVRHPVLALDGQLGLHGELGEGGGARDVHTPLADGVDGEHALHAGHTVKVAGQPQGHGEVDAHIFAAAEENVVHLDGGRAAVTVPR